MRGDKEIQLDGVTAKVCLEFQGMFWGQKKMGAKSLILPILTQFKAKVPDFDAEIMNSGENNLAEC